MCVASEVYVVGGDSGVAALDTLELLLVGDIARRRALSLSLSLSLAQVGLIERPASETNAFWSKGRALCSF